ncbi:MAG: hypothetical protein ACOCRO_02310 [Halanaerobiales bacterium]
MKPVGTKFISHNENIGEVVEKANNGIGMKFNDSDIIMSYNEEFVKEWLDEDKIYTVRISWTEIHSADINIKAKNKEELEKYLKESDLFNLRSIAIEYEQSNSFDDFVDTSIESIKPAEFNAGQAELVDDRLESEYL